VVEGIVATRFECWGADREDLTERLRAAYDRGEIPIFYATGGQEEWTFTITCSQGHENIIEGNERP
jgi:hypothetical protein